MIKRSNWVAGIFASAILFGGMVGGAVPARALFTTVTIGYTNCYGGLWDPTHTQTNISVSASQSTNGITGRFSWTVARGMNISPYASSLVFDSPSHLKMEGDFIFRNVPAHFEFALQKAGVTQWGTIGLRITAKDSGAEMYSTGTNPDGSVKELPMYCSSGSWLLRQINL